MTPTLRDLHPEPPAPADEVVVSRRVSISETETELRVDIAPSQAALLMVLLLLWLGIWAAVEVVVVLGFFGQGPAPWGPGGGSLVGIPWTLAGVFAWHYWFWVLVGSECLRVRNDSLELNWAFGPWTGQWSAPLHAVTEIVNRMALRGERYEVPRLGIFQPDGVIRISAGESLVRIGSLLTEEEATQIISAVRTRIHAITNGDSGPG